MDMHVNNIETKEIRGLSLKGLFWLIGATVTILMSVLTTYFSVISRLDAMQLQKVADDKYNAYKLLLIENELKSFKLEFNELKRYVEQEHNETRKRLEQ